MLAVGFVASRTYYWTRGVRFDAAPVNSYVQYVDPVLLRDRLWESVWHMREQAPLFNVYLGAVVKLPAGLHEAVFAVTFRLLGLALTVTLYATMVRLRVPRAAAALFSLWIAASPAFVLYESWLFYPMPVAALAATGAWALLRFAVDGRLFHAVVFHSVLAALVLIQGVFHPAWFVCVSVAGVLLQPGFRRRLIVAALGPAAVVIAFCAKQLFVFGSIATGSAYLGINLAWMTVFTLPEQQRADWIREGRLSRMAEVPYVYDGGPDTWRAWLPQVAPTGIPVLDQDVKSTGAPNWHSSVTSEAGALYLADALVVLRKAPEVYLSHVALNARVLLQDMTDIWPFRFDNYSNMAAVEGHHTVVDGILGMKTWPDELPWVNRYLMPAVVILGAALAWVRLRRGRGHRSSRASALHALFSLGLIAWVTVTTLLLSHGDHNRYRFYVMPAIWVMGADVAAALVRAVREGYRRLVGHRRS